MTKSQLDLFAKSVNSSSVSNLDPPPAAPPPESLDDAEIIARLPGARLDEAPKLAAEASRRGLQGAVDALEALCRRFAGFSRNRAIPEQEAALLALGQISGREAKLALTRMITDGVVEGPSLKTAIRAAGQTGAKLPNHVVLALLADHNAGIRAAACACTPSDFKVIQRLLDCLQDEDSDVRNAAVLALGRLGQDEARPRLMSLLKDAPTAEIIDAVASVADEDCVILLGRIACIIPDLRAAALEALSIIDHPTASILLSRLEGSRTSSPPFLAV